MEGGVQSRCKVVRKTEDLLPTTAVYVRAVSDAMVILLNDCNLDAVTNECVDEKRMLCAGYA